VFRGYESQIALVAVGFGSSETVGRLNDHQNAQGYPGLFVEGPISMARDFRVLTQSTKLGIGADGVVRFVEGYGTLSGARWHQLLQTLANG